MATKKTAKKDSTIAKKDSATAKKAPPRVENRIGDRWVEKDGGGREIEVVDIEEPYLLAKNLKSGRTTRMSIAKIEKKFERVARGNF